MRQASWTDAKGAAFILAPMQPKIFLLELTEGRSVFPLAGEAASRIPLVDAGAPWPEDAAADPDMPAPAGRAARDLMGCTVNSGPYRLASDGIPRHSMGPLRRVAAAAASIGMDPGDAVASAAMLLLRGRIPDPDLQRILSAAGELGSELARYCAGASADQYFHKLEASHE